MSTLLLRLAAPLQAWGAESKYEVRRTGREPTKSGVIGLLMAALGCRRDDTETIRLLNTLRMGVRVDRAGEMLCDFHTVYMEAPPSKSKKTQPPRPYMFSSDYTESYKDKDRTFTTKRHYLSDAVFLVGLESADDALLERLEQALHAPVFPLFLGRRSCPPTLPLSLGIRAENLEQALRAEPCQDAAWRSRYADREMRLILEGAEESRGTVRRLRDRPVSFAPERREYGYRFQTECEPVERESGLPAEHDAMSELEGGETECTCRE